MCRATRCAGREAMKGIVLPEVFKPYTAIETDPLLDRAIIHLDRAIIHLEHQIERLRSLKGSNPEIATVIGRTVEAFGDFGALWLVRYNPAMGAAPLDLVREGKIERVLTQIARIEHGIYA
jgi:hypothetical protein